MQAIQDHISRHQAALAKHPFLTELRPDRVLARALWFAPLTAFWAMGFQDVLRLNAERTADPEIRKIIFQHRVEDAGHDRWFLHDLEAMGRRDIDLAWLYGAECRPARDATYAIAAEPFRAKHDVLRLVLIMALEGAGHVLFGGVTRNLDASGFSSALRYFANSHLDVEKAHDLFAQEVQRYMQTITLGDDLHAESIALVDRVFAAFAVLADGLAQARPRQD